MAQVSATVPGGSWRQERSLERWQARRRWARAGITYCLMTFFGILFIGPLLFATISSLRTNPLDYPPSLIIPQLNPQNWSAAARLGVAGAGNRLWGGFEPGASVPFEVDYFVPEGRDIVPPEAIVPARRPGAGLGAVLEMDFAADYATVSELQETRREAGTLPPEEAGEDPIAGTFVSYAFNINYDTTGPDLDRLPLDVTSEARYVYLGSTLAASRIERRGRVASFDNVAPGVLGYIFHNYRRTINEARSITTGRSLFLRWMINSGIFAFFRVVGSVIISSMAGYALARLVFPGKSVLFVLVLFAQMIPLQVMFISNYLVLRDGIFGLTSLWGGGSLLNNLSGVVAVTLLNASGVFIMKQFFETIPREVEEAAMLDGTTHFQRFWLVVMPMARPAVGALTILTFQAAWNDFFWPFIILTTPEDIKTLPIGLLSFQNAYGGAGDWGIILAGAIMSALPIIVIFFVFQKYFLEGVSYGGSKE
ncbi:MAG: carbohydrate ABC transporter permease [Deinococcota bacterium]